MGDVRLMDVSILIRMGVKCVGRGKLRGNGGVEHHKAKFVWSVGKISMKVVMGYVDLKTLTANSTLTVNASNVTKTTTCHLQVARKPNQVASTQTTSAHPVYLLSPTFLPQIHVKSSVVFNIVFKVVSNVTLNYNFLPINVFYLIVNS